MRDELRLFNCDYYSIDYYSRLKSNCFNCSIIILFINRCYSSHNFVCTKQ